jgi:hypothetical protein
VRALQCRNAATFAFFKKRLKHIIDRSKYYATSTLLHGNKADEKTVEIYYIGAAGAVELFSHPNPNPNPNQYFPL